MPSRSRYTTAGEPVIVEITPSTTTYPSSPGSPKAVRFAPEALVRPEARALTPTEAWSLYHFETHAARCRECHNPLDGYLEGRRLCPTGHGLAQDVAEHVYRKDGHIYSRQKDNHKHVRVELPSSYSQVPQLLRSMERALRSRQRTVPIVSYDSRYPVAPRHQVPELVPDASPVRRTVIVEPAVSSRSTRRVVVEDDEASALRKERRGSLYYEDQARRRKEKYEVEIREPARRESRRDRDRRERPTTMFWG